MRKMLVKYVKAKLRGALTMPWILLLVASVLNVFSLLTENDFLRELSLFVILVFLVGMVVYYDYQWWRKKVNEKENIPN
jgi:carbon starvation protein CstA